MEPLIFIAMQNNPAIEQVLTSKEETKKQSIGIIHQKMQDRYKVVEVLPKNASTFDKIFDYADAYGQIRFAYFGSKYKEQTQLYQNSFGSAIGGIVGIKSAHYLGWSFNVAVYISEDLPFLYNESQKAFDFLNAQGDSYSYLAEASLNYNGKNFEMMIGRYGVDMPYANMDDLRMSKNTFEGAWMHLHYSSTLSSQLFWIRRWAGFDSQDEANGSSQDSFKELVNASYGMVGASLAYRYNEQSEASVWLHNIDKMAKIFYGEINGVVDASEQLHFDYGLQYAEIMENEASGVDGSVVGAMSIVHYKDFLSARHLIMLLTIQTKP